MGRYLHGVDGNHDAIVGVLKQRGWHVANTSRLQGFVDCVAAKDGRVVLIEIKDGRKAPSARRLKPSQERLIASFAAVGVTVHVIESIEQAARLE